MTEFREVAFDSDKGYAVFMDGTTEWIVHRETYEESSVLFRPIGNDRLEFQPGSKLGVNAATGVETIVAGSIRIMKT